MIEKEGSEPENVNDLDTMPRTREGRPVLSVNTDRANYGCNDSDDAGEAVSVDADRANHGYNIGDESVFDVVNPAHGTDKEAKSLTWSPATYERSRPQSLLGYEILSECHFNNPSNLEASNHPDDLYEQIVVGAGPNSDKKKKSKSRRYRYFDTEIKDIERSYLHDNFGNKFTTTRQFLPPHKKWHVETPSYSTQLHDNPDSSSTKTVPELLKPTRYDPSATNMGNAQSRAPAEEDSTPLLKERRNNTGVSSPAYPNLVKAQRRDSPLSVARSAFSFRRPSTFAYSNLEDSQVDHDRFSLALKNLERSEPPPSPTGTDIANLLSDLGPSDETPRFHPVSSVYPSVSSVTHESATSEAGDEEHMLNTRHIDRLSQAGYSILSSNENLSVHHGEIIQASTSDNGNNSHIPKWLRNRLIRPGYSRLLSDENVPVSGKGIIRSAPSEAGDDGDYRPASSVYSCSTNDERFTPSAPSDARTDHHFRQASSTYSLYTDSARVAPLVISRGAGEGPIGRAQYPSAPSEFSTSSCESVDTAILDYKPGPFPSDPQHEAVNPSDLSRPYHHLLQHHPAYSTSTVNLLGRVNSEDADDEDDISTELKNSPLIKGKGKAPEGYAASQYTTILPDPTEASASGASESKVQASPHSWTSNSPRTPQTPHQKTEMKIPRKSVGSGSSRKPSYNTPQPSPAASFSSGGPSSTRQGSFSQSQGEETEEEKAAKRVSLHSSTLPSGICLS